MSEPKLISPLLDPFIMGDPISDHGGVKTCPAMKKDSDDKYIVKIISVPASPSQLDALLLSGAYSSKEAALSYYEEIVNGIVGETKILQTLSNLEGFFCYEDLQVVPMEDGSGFDLYLLSPYRRTLSRQFAKHAMTHLGALNLGLDLCAALAVARQSGYLYAALKPENVYLTPDQGYRIGDIGFLQLNSLKYASLPDRYRSAYTAPEIVDAYSSLNTTMDVYAVGLILYQAFNGGILPEQREALPPPDYADYEIAEIILKACAAEPEKRWQDPVEMGQAIVSYIQRNGAHDTPIVPSIPEEVTQPQPEQDNAPVAEEIPDTDPVASAEEAAEESDTEEAAETTQPQTDEKRRQESDDKIFSEDDFGNLTFLDELSGDETLPGEDSSDVDYDQISVEVSDILTQADELLSHPTPDPVIPPEPIDVTLPPVQEADEEQGAEDAEEAVKEEETQTQPEEAQQPEPENAERAEAAEETGEEAQSAPEQEANEAAEEEPAPAKPKRHWIRNTIIVVLILALFAAGYFFYRNFYLQLVDSISLEGSEDYLTVYVDSQIDDELLTVICTDTYGNQTIMPVVEGKASFTDLAPDSAYTVKLAIKGFHKLEGKTSTAYTTPVRTDIVQFGAVTGTEDGSAVIGFAIEGPDVSQWKLLYGVTGEAPTEVLFSGHIYTLTGLTIGTEYSFELQPATDLYITGNNKTTHVAKKLVRAQNLTVTSCLNGKLAASWNVPEGSQVDSWTVHCYNEKGYDQTVVVDTTSVVLEQIVDADAYTLEVTAAGMSVGERVLVPENSVTVTDFNASLENDSAVNLSWNSGNADANTTWKLTYTVDNSPVQEVILEGTTSVKLTDLIPGSTYVFSLQTAAGDAVLGGKQQITTKGAEDFNAYLVTAKRIDLRMCKTPSQSGWDRYDLSQSDYTTSFKSGERESFLMHISGKYSSSTNDVSVQFVIRDNQNNVMNISQQTMKWASMWHRNYGEFDLPALPSAAGEYTVFVYFDGALVGQQGFTVTT